MFMKYHSEKLDFDALKKNNIDRIQLEMIPESCRILEIGCATGHLSEFLINEKKCKVTGIEFDPDQAAVARQRGLEMIAGRVDDPGVQAEVDSRLADGQSFDVVFMSQVIEHIAEPEAVLLKIREWLAEDGMLVISTCNIAHWQCRLRLLRGKWEYEDYGIFDRGHLRFFTLKSFATILEKCGYNVVGSGFSFEDFCPFKMLFDYRLLAPSDILRCIPFIGQGLRKKYIHLMRNLIATQFVYKAKV
jgi:methionine biosynthesis protein MetW